SAALRASSANKVYRSSVEAHWPPGGSTFWYEVQTGPRSREYVWVDAEKGVRRAAFDHARLAQALNAAGVTAARPDGLGLTDLAWSEGNTLSFTAAAKQWRVSLETYTVLEQKPAPSTALAGLALTDLPTASRRTGPETSLRFVNRTAGPVNLLWLDPDGERQAYGVIGAGQTRDQHTFSGHVWLVTAADGQTVAAFEAADTAREAAITGGPAPRPSAPAAPARAARPSPARTRSPDGQWEAAIADHNVVLREIAGRREHVVTTDGRPENPYRDRSFFWSPDSKKLVALRVEPGEEHKVSVVSSSPKDQIQPKVVTFDYLKPGDKLPHPRPTLIDVATKRATPIDDALFPNPFTENGNMDIRWNADSSRFTFRYNQRGHQVLRIIGVDAATGAATAIVDERSATFIDYSGKFFLERLDETGELIWMSERDGWNHLYLYDAKSGRVKNQITRGDWVVRRVERVDRATRQVWFLASGIVPGQDPYYVHLCRTNFDGSGLVVLTVGDGPHTTAFSPDRRFFIDTWSRVDLAPVVELRRALDGRLVCELERGDATALWTAGRRAPERFTAKGRDGETDICGVILRPSNFDPAKKYPVIENIYAGPHGAFVPKAFSAHSPMMELAELGFIVVQIDGMGTSGRSKKFHDVCWKNLGDAGLPDRILWIKAAAQSRPEMDLTRVGIYGTSAGGQSSLGALLTHSDFYKVGVSDCGCHDNRMDKIWWNEQWMGWPVGPHYAAQSNVTLAPKLQGKLLLMVGELDKNVDPASTMQVADALIKANKDFELFVMPGAGHGVAGTPYGKRRLQDFFVRHLLGKEPRWE
ncbi:MAG: prolyl oligopeptidase family serine peptidase, partial [Verrucomicrobia bacterium]|nr:prolyl oligopeptidase family serine peptidase [Verrucomicrobiota bacterium]